LAFVAVLVPSALATLCSASIVSADFPRARWSAFGRGAEGIHTDFGGNAEPTKVPASIVSTLRQFTVRNTASPRRFTHSVPGVRRLKKILERVAGRRSGGIREGDAGVIGTVVARSLGE